MYLPIVFGYEIYGKIPVFLGFFYKFISACRENNWPIICQKQYFTDPNELKEKYFYDIKSCFQIHGIDSLSYKQINEVDKYIIPNEITERILNECGNEEEAWIKIMKNRIPYFESYLKNTIKSIKQKYNKEIKAILVWRHNESVYNVCKELNIKIIEMEFTSLRYPFYNELVSYFQFSNKYSIDEFNERYKRFLAEDYKKLPILTRKEILSMFLSKDNINYINKLNDPVEYELGIALGLDKDYESKSTNCISNEDLIQGFETIFERNQTLYKPHPASNYAFKNNVNIDKSKYSVDFILKCRKVASVLSNVGFETMLYGKTSYIMGTMPYKNIAISDFIDTDEVVGLLQLNYILFAFYVPYNLMLKKDYLDWRLSNPSESDIYNRHMKYYFKNRGIPIKTLRLKGIERLKEILKYMNYDNVKLLNYKIRNLNFELDEADKQIANRDKEIALLNKKILVSDEKIVKLNETIKNNEIKIKHLNSSINDILNSSSWKLTTPLRKIKLFLQKKR